MEEHVNRFFDFFERKVSEIGSIEGGSESLFKKVLYSTLIDAVAKSVYPHKGNGERFIRAVDRFGMWEHGGRLSLPHLNQLLRVVPDPAFENLRKWVNTELEAWPIRAGIGISLERDPEEDAVRRLWPSASDDKKPLAKLDIRSFRHLNLFWAYRNSLVHELRAPGYGMEFEEDEEPFYHLMTSIDDAGEETKCTMELCYPTTFFCTLAKNMISNMRSYFIENKLNPYESYKYGTYWIAELNG